MSKRLAGGALSRRTFVKATAAAGLVQLAGPAIITARGEESINIGLDNPLTGTYAALGKNEQTGAALAFITDPWGTYIELNERPNPAYIN